MVMCVVTFTVDYLYYYIISVSRGITKQNNRNHAGPSPPCKHSVIPNTLNIMYKDHYYNMNEVQIAEREVV